MQSLSEMFAAMDTNPMDAPSKKERFVADGEFLNPTDAYNFMMGGNSTLTFRSKKTEARFTYKVRKSEDGKMFFVSLLTGSDNQNNYQYLGHVFSDTMLYFHGRKSKIGQDSVGAKAFAWVYKKLIARQMPDSLEVWHEGICGRCGRKLTVPESIASGFGPECINKMQRFF